MKISSNFRDYYDYVEYLYSQEGGDDQTFYRRVNVPIPEEHIGKILSKPETYSNGRVLGRVYYPADSGNFTVYGKVPLFPRESLSWRVGSNYIRFPPWFFTWIVVCGRAYLTVEGSKDGVNYYRKLITEGHPCLSDISTPGRYSRFKDNEIKVNDFLGIESETLVEISRMVSSPVFTISEVHSADFNTNFDIPSTYEISVSRRIPNLGESGFPSLISAEQMYQDIAMFMGQLKGNPDSNPPAAVSDKDRLIQRGFDAKVSFRGKIPKG